LGDNPTKVYVAPTEDGVKTAVTERDAPFADYSQGAAEKQPRKKSDLRRE
jgi:hypothetical protein